MRTSVFLEVSPEFHEDVIAPLKASKSFGKIILQLLELYSSNPSVKALVEGYSDLDKEAKNESVTNLFDDLNAKLYNFGTVTDMLDETNNSSKAYFEEKTSNAEKDIIEPKERIGVSEGVSKEEFNSLKEDIKSLADSVNVLVSSLGTGNVHIQDMVKNVVKDEVVIEETTNIPEDKKVVEKVPLFVEDDEEEMLFDITEDTPDDKEVSDVDVDDYLSNLSSGQFNDF